VKGREVKERGAIGVTFAVAFAALALGLVGVFSLVLSALPGGAPCTLSTCYGNRGLFASIGFTLIAVAVVSILGASRNRIGRAGIEGAAASAGLGALIALIVGFLSPIWAPPVIPGYGIAIVLITAVVVFIAVRRAVDHSRVTPDWPWVLAAYGVVRLILLWLAPVITGSSQHVTDDIFWWWLSLGVAPLAAGVFLGILRRASRAT
jgi:hypothetical protein